MGVSLFGQEHVDRYRETDGEEGHDWQGTTVLLLTTTACLADDSGCRGRSRAHRGLRVFLAVSGSDGPASQGGILHARQK